MDDLEKTFVDIDDLARKIEKRIKELDDISNGVSNAKKDYHNHNLEENMFDLTTLVENIDKRILEIEEEQKLNKYEIDIDELTRKVNEKLLFLDDNNLDDDLDRTVYDLSEVSKIINSTVLKLKREKEKKRKKAMYCDNARKNQKRGKKNNKHAK